MKIGYKLLLGFIIIYLLMVFNALSSIDSANRVDQDVSNMMESDYPSALASERMITALYDVNLQESYYLALGDQKYLEKYNTSKDDFYEWYNKALSVAVTDDEMSLLLDINSSFQTYDDYHEQIVGLYNDGMIDEANNLSMGASNNEFYKTYEYCIDLELLNTGSVKTSYEKSKETMHEGINTIAFVSVLSLAVAIILGFVISNSITKPIKALSKGAELIGKGELGHQIEVKSKDQLGELSNTFNSMSLRLNERNVELENKTVELEKANRELKKLDEMKSLLLGNVSHELRTPLASFKGHVELVLDEQLGEISGRQKEMLTIANQDADHLDRLIEELLVVPKIEFGRLSLNREDVVFKDTIGWSLKRFNKIIKSKNIDVEVDVPEDLPNISVDRDKIVQVFNNLIKNAVNFSPNNSRIKINVKKSGDSLVTSVTDNGIGIPEDKLEKIFEKFYQLDPTSTRQVGGVGLGLYICKGIIEAHGGKIWAESKIGEGTTLIFTLPIVKPEGRK